METSLPLLHHSKAVWQPNTARVTEDGKGGSCKHASSRLMIYREKGGMIADKQSCKEWKLTSFASAHVAQLRKVKIQWLPCAVHTLQRRAGAGSRGGG
eukprot:scaffold289269_cov41-Prasinocladus_malaysianus.AAC.2